jgi:hypothetical protein
MLYRRNPLQNPIQALNHLVSEYDSKIEDSQREFRNWLNDFYDKPNDRTLRYSVEKLGVWAAKQDMRTYVLEILDAVKQYPDDLETLLMAMYDRLLSILESPPPAQLRARYEQAQKDQRVSYEGYVMKEFTTTYVDHYALPYDTFVFNYLHSYTLTSLLWSIEKLVAAMRSEDNQEYELTSGDLVNQRHKDMANNISDRELGNVLDHINSIITGRTTYGRRNETIDSLDFTKLVWSNGSAAWYPSSGTQERALTKKLFHKTEIDMGHLDANMIIVPYPPAVVDLILSSLYPLPLYRYSFEAKARKSRSGASGPIVSDREARRLVRSIAEIISKNTYAEMYKIPLDEVVIEKDDFAVNNLAGRLWEKLAEAKRAYDDDSFEDLMRKYNLLDIPAFYGRLKQWFLSLEY